MNKKTLTFALLSSVFAGALLIGTFSTNNFSKTSAAEHGSNCRFNHYLEVAPTYNNPGVREYWICCTHPDLGPTYAHPGVGTIAQANHPTGFANSLSTSDARYLAPYKDAISFEDGFVPSIFTKQSSVQKMEVVEDGTDGNKCLKITSSGGDYRVAASKAYLDAVFSDSSIQAINFDAKGSTATNNFRYGTTASHPTYEFNGNGHGLDTNWKTFTFTRDYYNLYEDGFSFIYSNCSAGGYVLIDNVRPVKSKLTSYGFENGRLVDSALDGYAHKASLRFFDSTKECFVADGTSGSTITSYGFDCNKKTEGLRSLRITKTTGYVAFFLPNLYSTLSDTSLISFDMYSTVAVNLNNGNMIDGYNSMTYSGSAHPANEWVTYTITKAQINSTGRFLIIQGNTAGDFYFDNMRFSTAENASEEYKNQGEIYIDSTSGTTTFALSHPIDSISGVSYDTTSLTGKFYGTKSSIVVNNSMLSGGKHELIVNYRSGNKLYKEHIYLYTIIREAKTAISLTIKYMTNELFTLTGYSNIYRMKCNGQEIPFEIDGSNYLIPKGTLIQLLPETGGKKVSGSLNLELYSLTNAYIQPLNITVDSSSESVKTIPTFNGAGIPTHAYSSTSSYANKTNYTNYYNVDKLSEFANTGLDIIYEQAVSVGANETALPAALRYELDNAAIVGKKVMLIDAALGKLSRQTVSLTSGTSFDVGSGVTVSFNNTTELDNYVRSRLSIFLNEPNCYGISVGDEQSYDMLCGGFGDLFQSIHRVLKALNREDFYINSNLNPMNAAFDMLAGANNTGNPAKDYETYLEKYLEVSGNKYIQYDIYPIVDNTRTIGGAFYDSDGNITKYGNGLHNFGLRQLMLASFIAKKHNVDLYVVSQTITYSGTRIMKANDIAWLNNMIMGFGARRLSFFVYQVRAYTGSEVWLNDGSFLTKEGEKNDIYFYMQGMIAQVKNMAPVISSFTYEWSHVYQASNARDVWFYKSVLDGSFKTNYYSSSDTYGILNSVTTDNDWAIVTGLKDSSDRYMYMIQNAHNDFDTIVTSNITFKADGVYSYAIVWEAGTPRIVSLETTGSLSWKKSSLTLKLSSGRAAYVLFIKGSVN